MAKCLELHFSDRGRLVSAQLLAPYAFEKRRVTQADERNFHIFYALLNAPREEKARLQLTDWSQYSYLTRSNVSRSSSIDDAENYFTLRQAFKSLGFQKHKVAQLLQILAAILHLGNLVFVQNQAQDAAAVSNPQVLDIAADLLGVDSRTLHNTLVFKSKLIKRDITTLFLDAQQAAKQRDDLAEALYVLLLTWVTAQINKKLEKSTAPAPNVISLFDMPGYATRTNCHFDALAFHYIADTMHQFMLNTILSDQQHQSPKQELVDVYTHPAKGIFSALNAQANRHTPTPWMEQLASANNTSYHPFTIQHFWGSAQYDQNSFAPSNEDYLCNDFISLFRGNAYCSPTTNGLMAEIIPDSNEGHRVHSSRYGVKPSNRPTLAPASDEKPRQQRNPATVTELLNQGIQDLTQALGKTLPWFVLCMRPNELGLPNSCDSKKLESQQSSFGLSALAQRMRIYYNTSFSFDEFTDRYQASLNVTLNGQTYPPNIIQARDKCQWVLQSLNWEENMAMLGQDNKVHLSNAGFLILERDLRSLEKSESKKSKMATSEIGLYDGFSVNDDQMSSAVSDSDFLDTSSVPPIHEFAPSELMSQLSGNEFVHEKGGFVGYNEFAPEEQEPPMTGIRRKWLFVVWMLTWWIPSPFLSKCGGMTRRDIRMAWREKVALCILIFVMCSAMILFIIGFGPLLCPHQDVFSISELQSRSTKEKAYVAIRGEVFDLTKFAPHHWASEVIPDKAIFDYAGKDATNLFPVQVSALCDGTAGHLSEEVVLDFQYNLSDKNAVYHDFRYFTNDYRPDWYFEQMVYLRKNYRLGFMGYDPDDILKQATNVVGVGEIQTHRQWAILHGDVYDLTYYLMGGRAPRAPEGHQASPNVEINFMDNGIVELFRQLAGTDISKHFDALPIDPDLRNRQMVCLRNLFFVGKVDTRRSIQCQFSEYFLLIVTGILVAVIVFKFIAALQMGTRREPEDHDKFIVCQVPCYTEGEESLRKTIDSIAVLDYDDKRKLLFLVCDGMIVGSGNDRPTPRIVLDILGVDPNVDPEPLSFLSLGAGNKQHNMSKIYSGLYECSGHVVPYVVVVKVGNPAEHQKPGNRGKRDSQMVLMQFLNKVHFDYPMTPMELEIYHQIKNVIGVSPSFYEFVLMVDADTEVAPDSLNRMVSCFVHDAKIVGLCGETKLANERESWVTMIQVYEYYISHFLAKAFESLFGSVTCLPGCFCMYRIRSPTKNQPLLVSNQVIEDYAENRVNTLHQKNLLHLGEDRYLTTLILKHFPTHKTKFTADASCLTNAPGQWSVLLSQRRRWINSTVHNLGELSFLTQLCGFCCFSMRFVVILDLMSTLTMPGVVLYLGYLIYRLVTDADQVPMISILLLCGVYGLQALIFIVRRKWEHIGWMIIYILAIPLFSFFVPIYSFWHFDDFSWGNTRVVIDQGGQKKAVGVDEGHFDPKSIPLKKWSEHESELWENGSVDTKHTGMTALNHAPSGYPMMDAMSMRYSSGFLPPMAPPSVYSEPMGGGGGSVASYGPNDEEIRREVHRITATSDLMTMTKKQVREQLSRQFGVDMTYRKDYINQCIEEALHF
ncbi:chitin synthase-domain-containing protein [Dichotomocladium elegans]|nr:chitin synthase-domain-containing protein [Dichotomocladium elegans]